MIWVIALVTAIVIVTAIFAFYWSKKNKPKSEKEKEEDEDLKIACPQNDKVKPSKKAKKSKILKMQKHSPEMVSKPRKGRLQKKSLGKSTTCFICVYSNPDLPLLIKVNKSQEKNNKRALMAVSKALSLMSRKRALAKQNIQQMRQLRDLSSISTVAKSTWKSTATFTWKSTATITSTETDTQTPPKQLSHSTLTLPPKTTKMNLDDSDSSQKKHQETMTNAISNGKVSIIKPKTQVVSSGIIQLINQWTHE